ncbi:MAG: hypothetical protein EXS59_00125 [Candidatus Taylorbacteria bacterium]|nr:hypothetical protein [Candidatus Taylorbacteria bacterium]
MKKIFRLRGGKYSFQIFPLNHRLKDSPPPIPAALGDPKEALRMYVSEIQAFGDAVGPEYVPVPFTFPIVGNRRYGDFVGSAGQRELKHTRVVLTEEPLRLARPMQEVRRFADMAQVLRFPKSENCACVRDLRLIDGVPTFVIGPGSYVEVFGTMNSQGLRFDLTPQQLSASEIFWGPRGRQELSRLTSKLKNRYGSVTIRQAVHQYCGGLPGLGEPVASYILGMAAVIVTTDGYAVFGRRAKQRVSVNTGINLATSGGFLFDRERLESLGLSRFIETEILREVYEEVAIRGKDCAVTVLALVRELSRAGSPEILALIEFYGTLEELVQRMKTNHHAEQDVDAVFALPLSDARALVLESDAGKVLQPKALATMIMLDRHLKNRFV